MLKDTLAQLCALSGVSSGEDEVRNWLRRRAQAADAVSDEGAHDGGAPGPPPTP